MASGTLILFDLPSRPPSTAWSLNPWKTRLLLNYKGIDYRTEWVEYPEIKQKLKAHVSPQESGPSFTIPAVLFPDGTYVMDSYNIAKAIEEKYPEPPFAVDTPYLAKLEAIIPKVKGALQAEVITKVSKRLLNEASLDYWYDTRQKRSGRTIEELEKEVASGTPWTNAAPGIQEVTALLKQNTDGPFFAGNSIGFVDFVWAALLIFWQSIGDDVFKKLLKATGDEKPHLELLEAVAPWSKRKD